MRPSALPVYQQVLLDLLVPPIIAVLWGLMPNGWVRAIQRVDGSKSWKEIP